MKQIDKSLKNGVGFSFIRKVNSFMPTNGVLGFLKYSYVLRIFRNSVAIRKCKYIPNYNVLGNDGLASDDFYIDIVVSSLGSDFETLDLMFHTWKADCPEKEDKKKKDSQQQQAQALGRSGLFSIVSQIISYPAEATTPIQDKEFISRMKAQAASLL